MQATLADSPSRSACWAQKGKEMSEFVPVETKADLDCLDDDEILAGYRDGWNCSKEPGSDKSRSYWHGWRNAQVDCGRAQLDYPQMRLVRDILGARVHAH